MRSTRVLRSTLVIRPTPAALATLVALPWLTLAGCVDHRSGISGTQSLRVELVSPADLGDIDRRLPGGARTVTVNVTAYDAAYAIDTGFDRDVQVYAQFLGTLTPTPTVDALNEMVAMPLASFHLTAGRAMNQSVALPPVLGPTTLWIEDGPQAVPGSRKIDPSYVPTYATGASPVMWFRDPSIADIQTPVDETRIDALQVSPLQNKQVSVSASRYGSAGRLVVTSVFSQGYTVSDVKCSDAAGTPPCTTSGYDHVEVFSSSAPRDQNGRLLQQGQLIDGFSGGISEFQGLTEIGFPVTFATSDAVTPDHLPPPAVLDQDTWFNGLGDPQGIINFERNESAPIEIDNALVCPLDDAFDRFKEWKIDPSGACAPRGNVIDVVTAGVIGDLDPAALVGKTLPRVVGVLRPIETSGNIWIIYPRSSADLTLQ